MQDKNGTFWSPRDASLHRQRMVARAEEGERMEEEEEGRMAAGNRHALNSNESQMAEKSASSNESTRRIDQNFPDDGSCTIAATTRTVAETTRTIATTTITTVSTKSNTHKGSPPPSIPSDSNELALSITSPTTTSSSSRANHAEQSSASPSAPPFAPSEPSITVRRGSPAEQISLMNMDNVSAHNMYLRNEHSSASHYDRTPSLGSLSSPSLPSSSISSSESASSGGSTFASKSGETTMAANEFAAYSHLDRYGFLVVPPAAGEAAASHRTGRGGRSLEERELQRKQEKHGRREARRAMKWVDMLKTLEAVEDRRQWPLAHKKFENRLVKGIPECLRTKVWALLLGAPSPTSPSFSSTAYRELYLRISGFERQIDLDIERTLRDHILFRARFSTAQVSLFKILVAYSNFDPEVGYCQGMSTIAAFLLLYFEEEMAFQMLKCVLERDRLRTMFTAGFPMLFETFYLQEQLMRRYLPALQSRLVSFQITTSVYATKWYLTLFLGFPFSLATRIWDLFVFWGVDMLICVALALLKTHEHRLLTLEYEACMQYLSKLPDTPIDEARLAKLAWTIWKRINPNYKARRHGTDEAEPDRTDNVFAKLRLQYGKLAADPSMRPR